MKSNADNLFLDYLGGSSFRVEKHQSGSHDQLTHGNWAGGAGTTVMPKSLRERIESLAGKRPAATVYDDGYIKGEREREVTYESDLDRRIQQAVMTRDRLTREMEDAPTSFVHDVRAIMAESAMNQQGYIDGATQAKRMYRRQFPTLTEYLTGFPSGKFASRAISKHQAGSHDQESHGNWANGSESSSMRTKDITADMQKYFGRNMEEYKVSDSREDISQRAKEARAARRPYESMALKIIAERQGFADRPKIVSPQEMNELENKGWKVVYRGIQDFSYGGTQKVDYKASQLAEEFKRGDYYAGDGTDGDGLYFSDDEEVARGYAGPNGAIIKAAIPPKSTLSQDVYLKDIEKYWKDYEAGNLDSFWLDYDAGARLAAKGYRGTQMARTLTVGGQQVAANVYLIWDRSMLAVEEA